MDKLQRAGRDFLIRLMAKRGSRGGGAGAAGAGGRDRRACGRMMHWVRDWLMSVFHPREDGQCCSQIRTWSVDIDSINEIDESGTHSSQNGSFRVCRTIDCGRHAPTEDDFCPRCREEIDAVRDMARHRFVMRGRGARLTHRDGA